MDHDKKTYEIHGPKKSKTERFEICKSEINDYNNCIREVAINDPIHKCDMYMMDIQSCLRKIERQI